MISWARRNLVFDREAASGIGLAQPIRGCWLLLLVRGRTMDLQNIGSALSRAVARTTAATTSTTTSTAVEASAADGSTKVDISGPGRFFTKLQSMMQSDPAQAKDVLGSLATQLRDSAKSASGDDATRLNALADKLQQAAESGDASVLSPPGGARRGPPPGGQRPSGVAAYSQSQAQNANAVNDDKPLWQTLNASLDGLTSTSSSISASAAQL